MKLSPARTAAYDILFKIETERSYSSALLAQFESHLDPADRRLCHEIVLGVLRRQLLLDRYIDILTGDRKLDIEIRICLRIGLFQLYFLDRVPDHAVVNESVVLALRSRKASAKGLVNAVLRSAIRQTPDLKFACETERIAIETSHPEWLINRWQDQSSIPNAGDLARSNNETPPIAFRKTLKGSGIRPPEYADESISVPGCYIARSFGDELKQLAARGEIYFQDEASQMTANALDIASGMKFLDVCASPGGKVTAAALTLKGENDTRMTGAFAGDLTWRRVELLRQTCQMQGSDFINIVQYDAARPMPFENGIFDRVLVDAPCTGTGTIRHNPEIRYFLGPDDFGRLQKIQSAIIRNASLLVKRGGKLVYSTCSLEKEENEDVCADFMASSSEWRSISPSVPGRFLTDDGFARTFPHRDGFDGFFVATFQRA